MEKQKKVFGITEKLNKKLDHRLDHFEIKQGLDYCEQRKRK